MEKGDKVNILNMKPDGYMFCEGQATVVKVLSSEEHIAVVRFKDGSKVRRYVCPDAQTREGLAAYLRHVNS